MGVFNTELKKFKTNITGKELELKVNNAVFIHLQEEFGLSQMQFELDYEDATGITGSKFVAACLKANGIDVTWQEVAENTNVLEIMNFIVSYQTSMAMDSEPKEKTKGE